MSWVHAGPMAVVIAAVACSPSLSDRMRAARSKPCVDVVEEYAQISRDPGYREQQAPTRATYEVLVASCFLELRRPETALELVERLGDEVQYSKLEVIARANAQLGKEAETQNALYELATNRSTLPRLFLETPEFRPYVYSDWFISLAVTVWFRTRTMRLDEFATTLVRRGGQELLPLRVAAADPQRPTGELAAWAGIVRGGHIDRASEETILILEGVEEHRRAEREVTSITTRRSGWNEVETTPHYEESEQSAFLPNGIPFVAKFSGVNEKLVNLKTVMVFGRYAGRSGESAAPTISAFTLAELANEG